MKQADYFEISKLIKDKLLSNIIDRKGFIYDLANYFDINMKCTCPKGKGHFPTHNKNCEGFVKENFIKNCGLEMGGKFNE